MAGLADAVNVVLLFLGHLRLLQQVRHPENAGKRSSDFMADGRKQAGLGGAVVLGLLACLLARLRRKAFGSHVTGDTLKQQAAI